MTRYLVDTHAALWWLSDDSRLSEPARAIIADPANVPLVSCASLWEIAIKRELGKIEADDALPDVLEEEGFLLLAVGADAAWAVRDLPPHHRDPFDRLLVAQAGEERVPIITADARIAQYDVQTVW